MDSNHDIVPTLRMFNGVMMDQAADEIERLRAELASRPAADESAEPVGISVQMENLRRRSNALFPGEPDEPASTASKEAVTLSDADIQRIAEETMGSFVNVRDEFTKGLLQTFARAALKAQRDASKAEGESS